MALNSLGLGLVFTAQDLATGKINQVARSFGNMDAKAIAASRSMQRSFAQLGAGIATLAVGAGTLLGSFALANVAGPFSEELVRVGQVAQASAEDLTLMHDAAIRLGASTRFRPQEVTQGLGDLAQAGLNAQQSLEALNGTLAFAAGGQVEVTQSATAITSALKVFSLNASEAGMVADQFLRITNSTALAAGDMEQAMGSVARGAISANQRIEEMLPAIGLVRNTGVDVSVAAQSVSSALIFMAGRSAEFEKIGVHVTDVAGNFRPFLDIVRETSIELERRFPNAAERAAAATDLFSRFGLQAYTGVSQQLAAGVRDSAGNLYQGAAAVEFLRNEMANASGTAGEFADALNDTFEGRQAQLGSAMTTLGVVLGEGFETAWKPVVEEILFGVRQVIAWVNELGPEATAIAARFITWAGVVLTLLGSFIALKAVFALLAPFVGSMIAGLGGVLAAVAPLVVAFAALGAVFYSIGRHLDENSARFGDWTEMFGKANLAVAALMQLMGDAGGLHGDVLAELNQDGNQGLKAFIADVYSFGFRIVQFFRGIGIGFNAAIDSMGPAFDRLFAAFGDLWTNILTIFGGAGNSVISGSSERFVEWGSVLGDVFAGIVEIIVNVATMWARFVNGFVEGAMWLYEQVRPSIEHAMVGFGELWAAVLEVGESLGLVSDGGAGAGSTFEMVGRVLAVLIGGPLSFMVWILGLIARAIAGVVRMMIWLGEVAVNIGDAFANIFLVLGSIFESVVNAIKNTVDTIISAIGRMASAIPESIRPSFLNGAIGAGERADQRLWNRANESSAIDERLKARQDEVGSTSHAEKRQNAQAQAASDRRVYDIAALLARQAYTRGVGNTPQPQVINLQVDGETLMSANVNASTNVDERTFTPGG